SLLGHAWRLGFMLLLGAALSAAVAQLTATQPSLSQRHPRSPSGQPATARVWRGAAHLAAAPATAPFAGPALKWPAFSPDPPRHVRCSSLPPVLPSVAAAAVPLCRWRVKAPRG